MKKITVLLIIALISIGIAGCGSDLEESEVIYYKDKAAVLMYHHVGEESSASTIRPEQFSNHLSMLEEKGFNVISINEFAQYLDGKRKVPPNAVVITFDDGYQSFYQEAYPRLKEKDMAATAFVIVSRVGVTEGEIPKLTWEEMQEMEQDGMTIYSHTYDSHDYVQVNPDGGKKPALVKARYLVDQGRSETVEEFRNRITADLSRSSQEIESNLGHSVPFLALPYGWASDTALEIANNLGFKYIFTVKPGINDRKTDHNKLNRINAGNPEITADQLFQTLFEFGVPAGGISKTLKQQVAKSFANGSQS